MNSGIRARAVVTDVDGTIARDDGSVSSATLEACRELAARGIPLIAATARTPAGVDGLLPAVPAFTAAVCCNGGIGVDMRSRRRLWRETLPAATVTAIMSMVAGLLPDAGIGAFDGDSWSLTASYEGIREKRPRGAVRLVEAGEFPHLDACAIAVCHPFLPAAQVAALLLDAGITPAEAIVSYASPRVLDISPPGVDKASGVARALELLGVAPGEVVAFGDAPNDIPLFRLAGRAVAMGNAHPEALAAVDVVTESVADDGFSHELERLGMIPRRTIAV